MAHSSQLGGFQLGDAQLGGVPSAAALTIDASGKGPLVLHIRTLSAGAQIGNVVPPGAGVAPVGRGWWWYGPAGPAAQFAQFRELNDSE